jgi:hypothetical protein
MTTWITSETLTKEELIWLVETLKVTKIRNEGAQVEHYTDTTGKVYPVCVSVGLIYIETNTAQQDTLMQLKFGNRFNTIESRNRYNVNLY